MRKVQFAAVAVAFVVSFSVPAALPASAAGGDPLAVTSTGLTDGQRVGTKLAFNPVWTGDVTAVEVEANGRVASVAPAVVQARGLHVRFLASEEDTDAEVTVRVLDGLGGSAQETTRVHVDNMPPYQIAISPASGATVHGVTTVTFSNVPDDIAEIVVTDGPYGPVLARLTEAPWTMTFDSATTVGYLFVKATDRAANFATFDQHYHPDNSGPSVTVSWGSTGNIIPGGRNWIYPTVKDYSAIDRIEFWADGALRATGRPVSYDFGQTSRTVNTEFRAWDVLGNERISPVTFRVDASAPVVTSMSPASGALVRGSRINSSISATDLVGVAYATLDGSPGSDLYAPWASSTPAGKDGRHAVKWYVVDLFGHTATFTRYVTVDNTKPGLKLTKAPKNGAKVKGTVKVTASASDRNGVGRVELLINGKLVAKDTKAGYAFSINTAKYGKKIKMQLRAYDRAGNVAYTTARTWHR